MIPGTLVLAVLSNQLHEREQTMTAPVLPLEERRLCLVCSAALRSDNTSGRCKACVRDFLSIRTCACGCGQHLDERYPDRLTMLNVMCIRRVIEQRDAAIEKVRALQGRAIL